MNIFQCRHGVLPGGLECIYRVVRKDETGHKKLFGCARHAGKIGSDYYNLYPEHDAATGDIIYQHSNLSDPFKLGEIIISWENLTSHQSGRNFDYRSFPADIHPLYSVSEHNHPTKSVLGADDVGEVFGDENPALVHSGWTIEKFYGISTVEYCQGGIYGVYDPKADMIMHPCLRSHTDLPGWINYTNRKETLSKRELYIGFSSDEEIISFAHRMFKKERVASRMSEAMLEVKRGKFINLWTIMTNNFVDYNTKREFMSKVSMESLSTVYRGRANLRHFCALYNTMDSITWGSKVVDANGKEIHMTYKIHKDLVRLYKENILNWILNYPPLKRAVSQPFMKYEPHNRYWFVVSLLKQARKDRILNKKTIIPDWLVETILEPRDPTVRLFGVSMKYSELPAEYKAEYHDAQSAYLDSENPSELIENLYPGMINIKKELFTDNDKRLDIFGWGQFLELLKLGQRWSMNEIRTAYEYFYRSWIEDDPSIFYDWLDLVAELPMDEVDTVSKEEFDELLKKQGGSEGKPEARRAIKDPEAVQLMEFGARNFSTGGELSPSKGGRAFASNILDATIFQKEKNGDIVHFKCWDEWNAVKVPLGNWYEASARVHNIRESQHETFWSMLAATGGLVDDRKEIKKILDESSYKEAMEASEENVATLASVIEGGLDSEDMSELMAYSPNDGSLTHLDKGEGVWPGEE